jgi:hypothetical protein
MLCPGGWLKPGSGAGRNQNLWQPKYTMMKNHNILSPVTVLLAALSGAISLQAQTVAWWRMDAWSGDTLYLNGTANATHGIADSANAAGQGTIAGNSGDPNVADDPLYVWGAMENAAGAAISSDVAPSSMLNGITSSGSYDFHSQINNGGNMFFAADQFGREYGGPSATAELFFKTTGATTGVQTLFWAVQGSAFTDLQLNTGTAGQGGLEFFGWDGSAYQSLSLTTADYAPGYDDGQWHYAAIRYDAGTKQMSLTVANQDGSVNEVSKTLAADLLGTAGNGNIMIGRDEGENARFDGLIDEVRLSDTALADNALLGNVTAVPEPSSFALAGMSAVLTLLWFRKRRLT